MSDSNSSNDNPYESPSPSAVGGKIPYGPVAPDLIEEDKDSRTWGMFCHLSTLSPVVGVPGFVGPLVIWLIKKDEMPFVDDQGKEALNFQITLSIGYLVSLVLTCVYIGLLLLAALAVFHFVFAIIATVKANEGVYYRYPFSLRLIT